MPRNGQTGASHRKTENPKPKKLRDSQTVSRYCLASAWVYAACFFILFGAAGFKLDWDPFWISLPVSLFGGFVDLWISDRAADFFVALWTGGRKANWTVRESLGAEMEKIRYQKMQGRYEEAWAIADAALSRDPTYPELLLLQAQILWEGFQDDHGARECLHKIRQIVPKDQPVHRWAATYLDEIKDEIISRDAGRDKN
ncbi:MAG: tetratricopeptide repeat protein [Deltaproteobacteria bacterium]|nr:tetratricopeptide repeat protein [Deltaproteobacteria bacterium]